MTPGIPMFLKCSVRFENGMEGLKRKKKEKRKLVSLAFKSRVPGKFKEPANETF